MSFIAQLQDELAEFKKQGVYKRLNYIDSPQGPRVKMEGRGEVVILSSNNYLGLSAVADVVEAGKQALDRWGAGTASVIVDSSSVEGIEVYPLWRTYDQHHRRRHCGA